MILERRDPTTKESMYGIQGVDVDNGRQLYPYETKSEAMLNEKLIALQRAPKDGRFKDPKFISTLEALDRV